MKNSNHTKNFLIWLEKQKFEAKIRILVTIFKNRLEIWKCSHGRNRSQRRHKSQPTHWALRSPILSELVKEANYRQRQTKLNLESVRK